VGVAFESYYADERDQYRRASITGLGRLADEMDFDPVAIDHGIGDLESARQAADHLSSQQLDFLVLHAAACAPASCSSRWRRPLPGSGFGLLRSRCWRDPSGSTCWSPPTTSPR